jgi:hypothetical protein
MRWWRDHKRSGAVLATFAMLLQLVLCLGHVHLHELASDPVRPEAAASMVLSQAEALLDRAQPGDRPDEDDCPLCLVMHMVASGAVPLAPMLAQPEYFGRAPELPVIQFDLSPPRYASFQTRAPPRA